MKEFKEIKGRVTVPTENDFLEETKDLINRWGADAIRDSDGTKGLEEEIKDLDAKLYSTYFVARGENDFVLDHPEETQQLFLMSDYNLATSDTLTINFLNGYLDEQIAADYRHDPKEWWQVFDRTTNTLVDVKDWTFNEKENTVTISNANAYHEYTVNFLSYVIWDPTQMYNYITNDWQDVEKHIPFDVRQPHSQEFMKQNLRNFLEANPKTDVIRFTTFFYHFTLFFNDERKEKFVDWFGYGTSVSPAAIEAFEKEKGYRLTAEDFITEGSYNSTFKTPNQTYRDYIDFQHRFVTNQAKELVDIVHEYGKEAIMFLGDNWIGIEPFGPYFEDIGLDGVVGSVGGGMTLRVISDIPHVKYTEGRFLPYFFPDTFFEGNDEAILAEANDNWVSARRALLRSPLNRIGYGGYPSLAYEFPEFIDRVSEITDEFRGLLQHVENVKPLSKFKVAILNDWGKIRSWQSFMVAHALHYKQIYSYLGVLESLSGMDMDIEFISFDDIIDGVPNDIDVIINAGDQNTAFSGGVRWDDPKLVSTIRQWVAEGHGFIGIGEPSAYAKGGRFFQLADLLGIDKELGMTLSTDKYFNTPLDSHFITKDLVSDFVYGEEINNTYALTGKTEIIQMNNENVVISANDYGKGRGIYISGLPYNFENTRILLRSIYYSLRKENELERYFSSNLYTEVNVYPESSKVVIVNNTDQPQETVFYDQVGNETSLTLEPAGIIWGSITDETVTFD